MIRGKVMHLYRKKAILFLLAMIFMFLLIFLYSFIQLNRGIAVFQIGLDHYTENWIAMVLCVLGLIRVIYELYRIEHHKEYEDRIMGLKE